MIVERATLADLDAITEIELHSFPRPWPRASFVAELARDHARLVVARRDGRVAGFHVYWLVADEVHVLSIATHPDCRRDGVAAALLAHALDEGRAGGARIATLEVRRSNQPALALYARAGFTVAHVRARYYQDNAEDALVMLCELASSPTAPRP